MPLEWLAVPAPIEHDACDNGETLVRACVGCNALAPDSGSAYSLLSAKQGWRLQRTPTTTGFNFDWRCPPCWAQRKQSAGGAR